MQNLTITWLGHSAFRLRTPGGLELLFDPWFTGNPKFPEKARPAKADVILVSHGHSDHITDAAALARQTGATVVGIFESSFYQYDEAFTYTTLAAARDFRKLGEVVDGIEARTTDHYRSRIVGQAVQEALDYPYYTRDWKEVFPAFFQALKTERVMMFLLLTMIMVVAAFVIVGTTRLMPVADEDPGPVG